MKHFLLRLLNLSVIFSSHKLIEKSYHVWFELFVHQKKWLQRSRAHQWILQRALIWSVWVELTVPGLWPIYLWSVSFLSVSFCSADFLDFDHLITLKLFPAVLFDYWWGHIAGSWYSSVVRLIIYAVYDCALIRCDDKGQISISKTFKIVVNADLVFLFLWKRWVMLILSRRREGSTHVCSAEPSSWTMAVKEWCSSLQTSAWSLRDWG